MSLLTAIMQEVDKVTMEDYKKQRDSLLSHIKDLIDRLQLLSWDLNQFLTDTYINFTITKSLEQLNFGNRKGNILADHEKYVKIQSDVTSNKSFNQKLNTDEEFITCRDKLVSSFKLFNDLCVFVEGKKILEQANHDFNRYNYAEAILSVKRILENLRALKFVDSLDIALSNLQDQAENQLSIYIAHLSLEWEDIFNWSENKCINNLTYSLSVQQSDPVLIQRLIKTLYDTERFNAELGLFSRFFIDSLLHNVIIHNCDIFTEDHIGAIVFNIKIDLNNTNKPNYQTIFNNVTAVFEFLQSTLGAHFNNRFIEVFSELICGKFFNKIIEDIIRDNLPSCDSSYTNYKNLVVELDSFNKFLIDLKFVAADESPLNKYIVDTDCILYNKKCDKLLSEVRSLLSQSISYGTLIVGSNQTVESDSTLDITDKEVALDLTKPLFLPKCVISQNVKTIMSMIIEHLLESVKLPQDYSNKLVTYIKEIAIMYQCIVPMKFKVNLEHCPLDIALFFNNCFYLAHSLLGPPWKTLLPNKLADLLTTVLLECIQDLRILGLEKVSLYLQQQKNFITQNLEPKESLTWSHEAYEEFDIAINKALTTMKDLKACWSNVLPSRMYEMCISTLVQALCDSMLHRILADGKAISEQLVHMIALRFEDAKLDVVTLFEEPIEFETKIDLWTKFTIMPQLLKAQLLEIAEIWRERKEISQNYTCEEVRQIIKMRFADDKYRLKILKDIQ